MMVWPHAMDLHVARLLLAYSTVCLDCPVGALAGALLALGFLGAPLSLLAGAAYAMNSVLRMQLQ
jgi:hypothetical protein